ncbi:MAG: hypothetical protein ACK4NS_00420 [Saprospiraceae bacterium]
MSVNAKQIRQLIGENAIEEAFGILLTLLDDNERWRDLHDEAIVLKTVWNDYARKERIGIAQKDDLNRVVAGMLEIVRAYDKRAAQPLRPAPPPPVSEPAPPLPQQPRRVAQCLMTGDLTEYFVLDNEQIVGYNPMTRQSWSVAVRMPSYVPEWAWFIQFPNASYYSVDHQGRIWGLNMYGFPTQLGYVQYF